MLFIQFSKSDGSDELAVCCWDGSTYIFNHEKDILHFPVGQACQAFAAGRLAMSPGRNEPVLIYATCEQSMLIYHNLDVQSIPSCSLLHALATQSDVMERLQQFSGYCKSSLRRKLSLIYFNVTAFCESYLFIYCIDDKILNSIDSAP